MFGETWCFSGHCCVPSHTLQIHTVIIIVRILTWVVLSQITHCCFALNRSDKLFFFNTYYFFFFFFILNFYLCDGELQTDGKQTAHTFSSHINQTYTATLPVWCPSLHPRFLDCFVLVRCIFTYFLVWTHWCSQTISISYRSMRFMFYFPFGYWPGLA